MPINEASAASPVLQQGGTWLFTLRGRCCGQNETIPARTTGMGTGNSDEKTWRTVLWSRDGEGNLPKEQGGPSRTAHPTEIPTTNTISQTNSRANTLRHSAQGPENDPSWSQQHTWDSWTQAANNTYFCTTAPKKDHQRAGIPQGLRALGTLNIC